jgi:PIN domain nuclease of toxin-antitoxin system
VKLLLDTHALIWWLDDDERLGTDAREVIAEPANDVHVSVASLWEIAIKMRAGKLKADIGAIERDIVHEAFVRLDIAPRHLEELMSVPLHHRDPFDHLLIAQARAEDMPLMTSDAQITAYSVERIAADR